MPKGKANSKGKSGSLGASKPSTAAGGRNLVEINPANVYFTHSRVRPIFTGCNKHISETLQEIIAGSTAVSDIPLITVIENNGHLFSLNNRRLYLFKELMDLGLLPPEGISCYLKPALEREKLRYTPERCALRAKLMGGTKATNSTENDEECNEEEVKEENDDAIDVIKQSRQDVESVRKLADEIKEDTEENH
jgi:hypothetical protein